MYVRFNQIEFLQMESSANVDFLKSNSEKNPKKNNYFYSARNFQRTAALNHNPFEWCKQHTVTDGNSYGNLEPLLYDGAAISLSPLLTHWTGGNQLDDRTNRKAAFRHSRSGIAVLAFRMYKFL
jgi:hypothetical protein